MDPTISTDLRSEINSSREVEVTTSVNQSFLLGSVRMKTASGVMVAGKTEDIIDPVWILQDNTGYCFPEGGKLHLEAQETDLCGYAQKT